MIIVFLVIISLVMTTGTFAYWAIEVESADMSTQSFLQVGTQLEGTSWYEIINQDDTCEYVNEFIVPHDDIINFESISEYKIVYTVCDGDNQNINVDYDFVIYDNGKLANDNFYNRLMNYIHIDFIETNDTDAGCEYIYSITIDDDLPQDILNRFSKAEIYVIFDYNIN